VCPDPSVHLYYSDKADIYSELGLPPATFCGGLTAFLASVMGTNL
jgi:hypothetical protein